MLNLITRHSQIDLMVNTMFAHIGEQVKFDNQFINHYVASDSLFTLLTEDEVNDEWMAWCAFDGI